MKLQTPLRYPGGKARLYCEIADLIIKSGKKIYAEPFCGGAGVALLALGNGIVNSILLNDLDPAIYSFWRAITLENQKFLEWFLDVEVTIEEWEKQHRIYMATQTPSFSLACAAFFLNRTNFSGVLSGGAIGGKSQLGEYLIGCRFNKEKLYPQLRKIGKLKDHITVTNLDGADFIKGNPQSEIFFYIDPPYVGKGPLLYRNDLQVEGHTELAGILRNSESCWLLSYDKHPLIQELYRDFEQTDKELVHHARSARKGNEIFIKSKLMLESRFTSSRTCIAQ